MANDGIFWYHKSMELFVSGNFKVYFTAVLLGAVFIILGVWGAASGKARARSELVVNQAGAIANSLDFFYSDNGRFPTADEFYTSDIMLNYLNRYPQASDAVSETCPQTLAYSRPNLSNYVLNFCLASGSGGYKKGWNQIQK